MKIIESTCVPIRIDHIDTDQIIPARFLKAVTREGFGDNLFRDWRYNGDDSLKEEFDSLVPKDDAAKQRFTELHNKLFYPNTEVGVESHARNVSVNSMIALLAGGEQEQEGRAFFEKNDPQWLKDFDSVLLL